MEVSRQPLGGWKSIIKLCGSLKQSPGAPVTAQETNERQATNYHNSCLTHEFGYIKLRARYANT
jgi:hypothetical protein